jgi:hypothetical protein
MAAYTKHINTLEAVKEGAREDVLFVLRKESCVHFVLKCVEI